MYLLLYKTSFDILTEICHQWGKWLGPWSLQPDDNFLGPPQWKYDWLQQPEKPASTTHVLYEGITRPRIIGTHQTSTIICLFFSNPGLWCWSGTLQKLGVCAWWNVPAKWFDIGHCMEAYIFPPQNVLILCWCRPGHLVVENWSN